MKKGRAGWPVPLLLVLTSSVSTSAFAQDLCTGEFDGGRRPSDRELDRLLRAHEDGLPANFCGADLSFADLNGANLSPT